MQTRDIIIVGASAGGVQALTKLVSELTSKLSAAVFIVLHAAQTLRACRPSYLRVTQSCRWSMRELLLTAQKGGIADEVFNTAEEEDRETQNRLNDRNKNS